MSIVWFKQAARGRGSNGSDKSFKITFTNRPKGVRLNAALTKHLVESEITYVKIGVMDDRLLIKPAEDKRDGFKLIINKNSGQVCSTAIGEWAEERGLLKLRSKGSWSAEHRMYEFDLSDLLKPDVGGALADVADQGSK